MLGRLPNTATTSRVWLVKTIYPEFAKENQMD